MAKSTGWVPQQHGAWAMIVVPYLTGLALAARVRPLDLGDAALGLTWLVGYFAFNAAVLTLKSPAKRRGRYYAPLGAYLAGAAVFGLVTLVLKGWPLLCWVPRTRSCSACRSGWRPASGNGRCCRAS
ncbi:YwiC-like family protein [Tessaracoccus sp. HDW20]|uniref:YwiC-like family protein n=1 Tax=Tessaracoccus coleopterorum TaxID=2714950 RepID=UPI0018D49740|nr:YwiC-like family protein [Tessaracoccus coleopterorum]NHB85227.1 YwiC-like family protein [Tessaracoccus coleopterorum]